MVSCSDMERYIMNAKNHIFNRKLLKSYLDKFDVNAIPNIKETKETIGKWKYSIENRDLDKTKEISVQGSFLSAFFHNILGYKQLYGNSIWNLNYEQKTVMDGTRADGALGFFTSSINDVRVIIELKDGKTCLDKKQTGRDGNMTPVEQGFSYAPKIGKKCRWVIVSNFKEIRLYHSSNQLEYEQFLVTDLLNDEDLKRFYFLLCRNHLIDRDKPSFIETLYEKNEADEKNVTKIFYRYYKETRLALFNSIKIANPNINELLLLEKTQKLLDRFIFVCFCEGTGLLPPQIFKQVLQVAGTSFDISDTKIWNQLKGLFNSIDKGNANLNIHRFNGGLFSPDPELDNLIIKDDIFVGLEKLGEYDFSTDLNVNILGHIFEQSIGDIEELKAEINGEEIDETKGKRKKDGIFYTPEYITHYIVEETIGGWLTRRREDLGENLLTEIPPFDHKATSKEKNIRLKILKTHIKFWTKYKDILYGIKVIDPACGSGAFLNQAFDYLLKEGQRVNQIISELEGGQIKLVDYLDKLILKNNLFGVDINQESIEITKLSLWLKTANKHDTLAALDKNILCGNSLIDDKKMSKAKAFVWQENFKDIFENGGFDVVIGNPPWGAKLDDESKAYLKNNYKYATVGKIDTYKYFYEKAFVISKVNARIGMITPNTFLYNIQSQALRSLILDSSTITDAIELRKNIFEDAPDVVPAILILDKQIKGISNDTYARVAYANRPVINLAANEWMLNQKIPLEIFKQDAEMKINLRLDMGFINVRKLLETQPRLHQYFDLKQGTKPFGSKGKKDEVLIKKNVDEPGWEKAINGRNINRYWIEWDGDYVFRSGNLHSCLPDKVLKGEKLYFQRMRKISLFPRIVAAYDNSKYHGLYTCSAIFSKQSNKDINIKYLLCLLNSHLINMWYKYFDTDMEIKLESVKQVPIVKASPEIQEWFCCQAETLISRNQNLHDNIQKFVGYLSASFGLELNGRLKEFYTMEYSEFLQEFSMKKVNLSEKTKYEMQEIFERSKANCLEIQKEIAAINHRIDMGVYKLYGLNEDQISLVQNT